MNLEDMNLIFVDVEATTATPATGTMTQFGAVHYHTRKSFHGLLFDSYPDPDNPAKPKLDPDGKARPQLPIARAFSEWATGFAGRPIFVSDNNGYDFMWIACFFDTWGLANPFGHSSRRISDFYAGLMQDFGDTQKWKKWRITPHTHHPVDDAMGNVEAFTTMLQRLLPKFYPDSDEEPLVIGEDT